MQQLQNQVQRLLKTGKTQFHSAVQERTIPKSAIENSSGLTLSRARQGQQGHTVEVLQD